MNANETAAVPIPIDEAWRLGLEIIRCPILSHCGGRAVVSAAREGTPSMPGAQLLRHDHPVRTAQGWFRVHCEKCLQDKLYQTFTRGQRTMVEPIYPDPESAD